jgi:hypothetical protein
MTCIDCYAVNKIGENQMDRKIFEISFSENNTPDWQCPTCGNGLLRIIKGTFFKNETSISIKAHSDDAWEPNWIEYTYSCLLQCTNNRCKGNVSNIGIGMVNWDMVQDEHDYPNEVYRDLFKPLFFNPPLKIIRIPNKAPEIVSEALNSSFALFFCSPSAASNHVRTSVEELLTDLKVKRFELSRGKRRSISLNRRIELLPAKYLGFKDLLLAIKWLGNAGSHSWKEVKFDDVMDAYEIMEHLLAEIYDSRTMKVKALAKKVNTSKGPKKK